MSDPPKHFYEHGSAGHPVRAAILIAVAVFLIFAGLVYAVLRFSVRPETEASRQPRASPRSSP